MLRFLCLAVASLLFGCSSNAPPDESVGPHGSGIARAALTTSGYHWRTHAAPSLHLHYLPDSYAAQHIQEFARKAEAALRHDLALIGQPSPPEPLELFLVNSREQAKQLTGNSYMGQAIPGEMSAFFVVLPGVQPAFRHEIMHALSLSLWGTHRTGSWLSEGVATWAAGTCQGKSVDAIAAGFLREGQLLSLSELAAQFWSMDELNAYLTAGSAVGYVARTRGNAAIEALWRQPHEAPGHPLGHKGAEIEVAWRSYLTSVPAAEVDTILLRRHGCEQV